MNTYLETLIEWYLNYEVHILFSILIIITYFIFRVVVKPKIETYISRDNLNSETLRTALFSFNILSGILTLILILFVWGFNFKVLFAFSTGLIAITGVALFANWSILSNITAFFILLIHQSYKTGNLIRVIDSDNYIEGKILEISLFSTKLMTHDGEMIVYPNNLLVTRPVLVNPVNRYEAIGKTDIFKKPTKQMRTNC